jgi:DNA mismatch repair protein MutS
MSKAWETPMMKQWQNLKRQAGESLLFFRLGDFYELFAEDAVRAAPLMGVTLTSRNGKADKEEAIPLCGVPHHHFEMYAHKLLEHGESIAIAEQTEEASPGKSLVQREIIQWLLPNEDRPHYIGLVAGREESWILAACDVATGHCVLETASGLENLWEAVSRLPVEDLRIPYGQSFEGAPKLFQKSCHLQIPGKAHQILMDAFSLSDIADLPIQKDLEIQVLGSLIGICQEAHPQQSLRFLRFQEIPDQVWMGASTRRHLHLFEPKDQNLFQFLDETRSAFGRRELKQVLSHPVFSKESIQERQKIVRYFKENPFERKSLRKHLHEIYDLERLLRRRRKAAHLYQIRQSLMHFQEIAQFLTGDLPLFHQYQSKLKSMETIRQLLESSLQWSEDEETGWICPGVLQELDDLRALQKGAEQALSQLEDKMRVDFGVPSLRIKFHQSFGYVAEVTRSHREKISDQVRRVQSLTNSERFKTPELESLEEKLLSLSTRLKQAELGEVERLYNELEKHREDLSVSVQLLGQMDCFQSLAEVSTRENWVTARLSDEAGILKIKNGRHPLTQEDFVPLSFELSPSEMRCMLLTGPNMAGKSTVLRVAGISALLHQIGSDLPAEAAELSLFDRIMCRMGAQDDLHQGKSTFFVEMKEVSQMLSGASDRSLLLFDEVGRGTSTYDGMSLAWAITEEVYLLKGLSMVATHYLELSLLENQYRQLRNYHLGVKELKGRLLFTRRLERGPASRSYGIQVARLAQLPESLLQKAEKKLREFEKKTEKKSPLFEWGEKQNYVQ